jgi:hypothetical protein
MAGSISSALSVISAASEASAVPEAALAAALVPVERLEKASSGRTTKIERS